MVNCWRRISLAACTTVRKREKRVSIPVDVVHMSSSLEQYSYSLSESPRSPPRARPRREGSPRPRPFPWPELCRPLPPSCLLSDLRPFFSLSVAGRQKSSSLLRPSETWAPLPCAPWFGFASLIAARHVPRGVHGG